MVNDNKANIQADSVSAALPGGRVFVSWKDLRSGDPDIYTSVSADGMKSFSTNKRADDSPTGSQQIAPSVASAQDGTVLLVWQDNRRCTFDFDVFFSKSSDGGKTFAPNVKVDDSGTDVVSWQEHPSVTVTSNGTIYVAWTDDRTGVLRIRGAYSSDGGRTFSPSAEICPSNASHGQTDVVLASKGDIIYAAFIDSAEGAPHPYLSVSTDGGRSFSRPVRLDGTGVPGCAQNDLSISALPGGGAVVAWEDSRNGNWDIYAAVVGPQGELLRPPVRVDDDLSGAAQKNPSLAVDRAGTIYCAWEDERSGLFAIRFAYLKVGSSAFTPSVMVSPPKPDDMQRKPSMACIEPGLVIVSWQDDRLGTYDVYASVGYFPNLFDLSLSSGWNFVSVPLVGWGYKASTLGLSRGDIVVSWNESSGAFERTYVVGVSPSTSDFLIEPGKGYMVYASTPKVLQLNGTVPGSVQRRSVQVPPGGGWVAMGFRSLRTDIKASDLQDMYSVQGGVLAVAALDPSSGSWKVYCSALPFTDFPLSPGQAFWVWCAASGEFAYVP